MIQLHGVHKRYPGGQDALIDVSFKMQPGEMAFLTGHSGAGKSTLLKMLCLVERPNKGQILFDQINLSSVRRGRIPYHRRRIGMVYQNNMLLNDRTVFENVALPMQILGYRSAELKKRVRAALDKVGLLSYEKKFPLKLSAGEQQRVGIARAVVSKPKLILADEPTGNLDPDLSREIMNLFQQFNQVGVTVLVATHDISLIQSMDIRVIHLDHGYLVEDTH
jgi:cell division transport system ATP-binding protein